jgi:protein-L-isoaspartate(D-aspartate) O-methyltransferase
MADLDRLRTKMVQSQLQRRGIADLRVLEAFGAVKREAFVAQALAAEAYEDRPLSIDCGQTISQPYVVAATIEALGLHGAERVLEVGTGSGYAAAILGRLAREVFTLERLPALANAAKDRLAELGVTNVEVRCGDGTLGWPAHAPFEAIAVAAGGPKAPPALLEQLAVGGRLVMPIGARGDSQVLTRITRLDETQYRFENLMGVRFVPLIGAQGFAEDGQAIAPRVERPG